jgi:hypothetical protein
MRWLRARSLNEAVLFTDLRPCACGETSFVTATLPSHDDGVYTETLSGDCTGCGRSRTFTFELPLSELEVFDGEAYGGPNSSTLIDAGEWLALADLYAALAEERRADPGRPMFGESVEEELQALSTAVVATLAEVLKFLPPGADRAPESAFWSQPGRLSYELAPQRFTREALERQIAGAARRLGRPVDDTAGGVAAKHP